jgi:plastocyanin
MQTARGVYLPGWVLRACLMAVLTLLGGCGQGSSALSAAATSAPPPTQPISAPVAGAQVTIDNFSFTPSTRTIAAGKSVTWINHDDVPHTITAQDHAFSSAGLDTDDQYTHQFASPGTYIYYCTIHPKMTATIVVR